MPTSFEGLPWKVGSPYRKGCEPVNAAAVE
jgi:hypothetical protein